MSPVSLYYCRSKRKKSRKIGIITDFGYFNFGNRLQNYALHFLLRSFGKKPVNIIFERQNYNFLHHFYNFITKHKDQSLFRSYAGIYRVSKDYEGKDFCYSKHKKQQRKLCRFETILVGSDQVWNSNYHHYENDLEYSLGNFNIINAPFRLVSYAASICMERFTESQSFLYHTSLSKFDTITVRESDSQRLLNGIGINSSVVLDPVFLLNKSEWDSAINRYSSMSLPSDNYCMIFILGKSSIDIESICKNLYKFQFINDNTIDNVNQFDFLKCIKNSSLVITNSFHAFAFCYIFGKSVYLFDRNDKYTLGMSSRFKDLLDLLGLDFKFDKIYDFSCVSRKQVDNKISSSIEALKAMIL